jgi:hypothetical protein
LLQNKLFDVELSIRQVLRGKRLKIEASFLKPECLAVLALNYHNYPCKKLSGRIAQLCRCASVLGAGDA